MERMTPFDMSLGAVLSAEGTCSFLVWAPRAQHVEVHVVAPAERSVPMQSLERGYYGARIERVVPGSLYRYRLDKDRERPDPASRLQPQGVHGPSQIVPSLFDWDDHTWRGIPIHKYVLYELHVGTFTPAGTFAAAIPRIPELKDLGITAIEIMPVAQFPGTRNWG
jgi:maltooligosyltrehalose trehalohydrolase